jgi:hypothetical protein
MVTFLKSAPVEGQSGLTFQLFDALGVGFRKKIVYFYENKKPCDISVLCGECFWTAPNTFRREGPRQPELNETNPTESAVVSSGRPAMSTQRI